MGTTIGTWSRRGPESSTPVAIKLVHKRDVPRKVDYQGRELPVEIPVMLEMRRKSGRCDNVIGLEEYFELADWWVLVLEKPKVCQDLFDLITERKSLNEVIARKWYQVF